MKIETQTVEELFYVLKQMMEENKGDYTIMIDDKFNSDVVQCKIYDDVKALELIIT